jgi:hypothetical protein
VFQITVANKFSCTEETQAEEERNTLELRTNSAHYLLRVVVQHQAKEPHTTDNQSVTNENRHRRASFSNPDFIFIIAKNITTIQHILVA